MCVFSVFFVLTDLTEVGILIYVSDMTRFYTSIYPTRSHRAAMNNDKVGEAGTLCFTLNGNLFLSDIFFLLLW